LSTTVPEIVEHRSAILKKDDEVVGTVPDDRTAIDLCSAASPDVFEFDVWLPDFGGIEIVRCLRIPVYRANIIFSGCGRNSAEAAFDALVRKIPRWKRPSFAMGNVRGTIFVSNAAFCL